MNARTVVTAMTLTVAAANYATAETYHTTAEAYCADAREFHIEAEDYTIKAEDFRLTANNDELTELNATPTAMVDTAAAVSPVPADTLRISPAADKEAKRLAYKQKYGGYTPGAEFNIPMESALVAFGLLAKADKKNFRSARQNFIPSYKSGVDDYIQFAPVAISTVLNVAGYEGRSNLPRYLLSVGLSYVTMAALVNGIKYTASEMRPDGSTANSFPSGHTATAFTAATILHKEYGLTRSPWWSVLGYATATATGIMRTLNNRHWISDVLVGAGVGVISTDLGYMFADLIMKNKGIKRQPRDGQTDLIKSPSFFRLSLGMQAINNIRLPTNTTYNTTLQTWGAGGATLDDDYLTVVRNGNPFRIPDSFDGSKRTYNNYMGGEPTFAEGEKPVIRTSLGTTVGAEAAYFFNQYIGLGARARITTAATYAEGLYCYDAGGMLTGVEGARLQGSNSATDVLSIADVHIGLHGAYPITPRHSIGAKMMYGRRFFGSLDLQSAYDLRYRNKQTSEESTATIYGDNLSVGKTNADAVGVGINYTYSSGRGMAISGFVDYDYARPEFEVAYTPYNTSATKMIKTRSEFEYRQAIHAVTVGASMVVMF